MDIERHLDWITPRITIYDGRFEIEINKDNIEVQCDCCSEGTEYIDIPIKVLQDLITEFLEKNV